ncbi:hypothetical protein PAMP_022895 [Pampus punctatissimus]
MPKFLDSSSVQTTYELAQLLYFLFANTRIKCGVFARKFSLSALLSSHTCPDSTAVVTSNEPEHQTSSQLRFIARRV